MGELRLAATRRDRPGSDSRAAQKLTSYSSVQFEIIKQSPAELTKLNQKLIICSGWLGDSFFRVEIAETPRNCN